MYNQNLAPLNGSTLSLLPKNLVAKAAEDPKCSKRRLAIKILKVLTGEPEQTINQFLNNLSIDLDMRQFSLKV